MPPIALSPVGHYFTVILLLVVVYLSTRNSFYDVHES
jgi:hypothetical protein